MNKPLKQILYWAPRIAGILFSLFLSMFALNVFGAGAIRWETLLALFLHLILGLLARTGLLFLAGWVWKKQIRES